MQPENYFIYDKEIVIKFSEPDKIGVMQCSIDLPVIISPAIIDCCVNGIKYKYTFRYHSMGKINDCINIKGQLTNISIDWSKNPSNSLFPLISFGGTISKTKINILLIALK